MSKLIIICGISFAGKSTLGSAITNKFDYEHVDVDEVKGQLFGSDMRDENLSHADWVKVYEETDKLVENYLTKKRSVVDDSRNFKKSERQKISKIATGLGADVITIFIDTPESVARQRLTENRETNFRRNVTDKDFEETLEAMEQPTENENPLIYKNGEDTDNWITNHEQLLG